MKKIYALITILIIATSLIVAGCGKNENATNKPDVNQSQDMHNSKDMPNMDHSKM